MSYRELAQAIRSLEQEKKQRLAKEKEEQERSFSEEEERTRRATNNLDEKKRDLAEKIKKEEKEVQNLEAQAVNASELADREQKVLDLQRRIAEFAGNDNESLRERLIKEGFGEELVTDSMRRRTLEQSIERTGGLQARFLPSEKDELNPLERLMAGVPRPEDLKNKGVLYALSNLQEEAAMKGYLSADKQQQLDNVLYFSDKFQQNEMYRNDDQHGYFSRVHDAAEAVRRGLGLDSETSGLTYGRK